MRVSLSHKMVGRRNFCTGAAAFALTGCHALCGVESAGTKCLWKRGHFQIHQIYTGTGESLFLIFPDGTTLLLDCGDGNPHTFMAGKYGDKSVPIPQEGRYSGGEAVARYVARVSPRGTDIDYLLLTHFHGDHSDGFARAADTLRFHRAIDRGWPSYDDPLPYPKDPKWMGGSLTEMRKLYARLAERDGLVVEKFRVGGRDQLRMLHEPSAFPDFSVFNLCGNGKIALKDGSVFDCYAGLAKTRKECTFNENGMSCGNIFSYGKFRFYSAGDFSDGKMHTVFNGVKMRIEKALSFAVGPVSVAKADHHACWGNPTELIAALRPKVWTIPVWWQLHATRQVMNNFASRKVYPGERMILPGVLCAERRTEDAGNPYLASVPEAVHTPSHIVIDVPPGGETFKVACLDPAKESLRVKALWSFVATSQ